MVHYFKILVYPIFFLFILGITMTMGKGSLPTKALTPITIAGKAVKETVGGKLQRIQTHTRDLAIISAAGKNANVNFYAPGQVRMVKVDSSVHKIFLVGDATVCNYKAASYPQTGWGQVLPYFFSNRNIIIENHAEAGRSSRSFYLQQHWKAVQKDLHPGDYVFIQFGHTDRNNKDTTRYTSEASYKIYLRLFVDESRKKGAIPILISPVVTNTYRGTIMRNLFTEAGNDYRGAMETVAAELKVPFVDLNMKSFKLFQSLGTDYISRFIYNTYAANEYPNYPEGLIDGAYFQEMGAIEVVRLIIEGLNDNKSDPAIRALLEFVQPTYPVSVVANIANPGLITRTGSYPPGVTVTLKVVPTGNTTFLNWNNIHNVSATIHPLYTFKMGATPLAFAAMFKGGSITSTDNVTIDNESLSVYPNPFSQSISICAPGTFNYYIKDVVGNLVETGNGEHFVNAGSNLLPGMYILDLHAPTKTKSLKITKF